MESGVSLAAELLRRSRDTWQLKRAHAVLLSRKLPFPPSPGVFRYAFSHAALDPAGDLRYVFLLLISLPFCSTSSRIISAVRFLHNTVIRGLARSRSPGSLSNSIFLFRRMIRTEISPNRFTFTFLLQSCASESSTLGFQLHGAAVKNGILNNDVCVRNSLIRLYSNFGSLNHAKMVFYEGKMDLVSYNSMIAGCLNNEDISFALFLFDRMPERNCITWNSLLAGLIKNDRLDAARCLFDEMTDKNLISFVVMTSGYAQRGQPKAALLLFREMLLLYCDVNVAALVSALSAVSQIGSLNHGLWIHAYIRRHDLRMEPSLSTAIITMYATCGSIELALQFFLTLKPQEKDLSTYTAVIFALGMNSLGWEGLRLFEQMKNEAFKPDRVSYLAVLFCCSHMGWVDRGFFYFKSMIEDDGIMAELDHYACMVDLLGRAGLLKEAEEFISSMPVEPDEVIWGALLNACRIHGNAEVGRRVGEFLIEFDGLHDGPYILLSNILVESKRREIAEGVMRMMKISNVTRTTGFSSVEVNGVVHEFVAGDISHEKSLEIYQKLEEIAGEIKGQENTL